MRTLTYRHSYILLLLLISYFFALPCLAQQGIKERMLARIPAINSLLDQGVIGENNKGFLEFRKNSPDQKNLIAEENQDRLKVYTAIAKQQGVSPQLVGERRAKQIVEIAKPGTWLQDESGNWYQK